MTTASMDILHIFKKIATLKKELENNSQMIETYIALNRSIIASIDKELDDLNGQMYLK